jgi:uncharacterized protein YjiS (DUF1127 family)
MSTQSTSSRSAADITTAEQPCTSTALRADQGALGSLTLWIRERIRYARALYELHQLENRDLDDIGIARVDFPALAWRHATGAPPLVCSCR